MTGVPCLQRDGLLAVDEHMLEFAAALPAVRAVVDAHLGLKGLPRAKVLATVVRLTACGPAQMNSQRVQVEAA